MNEFCDRLWALCPEMAQDVFLALRDEPPAGKAQFGSPPAPQSEPAYTLMRGVAVIQVSGPITRESRRSFYDGLKLSQGQDEIAAALQAALADPQVKSVLLSINSPGGVVQGTKELADAIAAASKVKPMAAYADGIMLSAAMWLGAATGRVFAPATATVGSIGVIYAHADYSKLNERLGVTYTYISAGKFKAAGNEDTPLDETARSIFQTQADQIHALFKGDVRPALNIQAPESLWAEGQCLLAGDALRLGLVTTIVRDRRSAITLLSQEANMDYASFKSQHPELLAKIEARAKAEGIAEAEAKNAENDKAAQAALLALVGKICGEEAAAKVGKAAALGLDEKQFQAMLELFGPETKPVAEQDKKAELLAALNAAGNKPLEGGAGASGLGSAAGKLLADAARRKTL